MSDLLTCEDVRQRTRDALQATVPELTERQVSAMEKGIWNWALEEAGHRDCVRCWDDALCDDYCRRAAHCAANMSRGHLGNGNTYLLNQVLAGDIEPYHVPFLDATRLNPPLVSQFVRDKARRDAHDHNQFVTASSLFECPACGARKSTYRQLQTRSGDEGSTIFLSCLECGHKWTDTP